MRTEQESNSDELMEYAGYLADTFIQRRDLYAIQRDDGRYMCIRKPLTDQLLRAHLAGDVTLGAYVLNEQSRGRFLVFDADDDPDWRRLQALAQVLEKMGAASYLENSRRGGHLWLFFERFIDGKRIRRFGHALMEHFGMEEIEMFPKQSVLKSGPGSLIRLPFGVHRKSGRRYGFTTARGEPLGLSLRDQIEWLAQPECIPELMWRKFEPRPAEPEPEESHPRPVKPGNPEHLPEDAPLSQRLKAAISVREFVLRYVELSPRGQARCPFHDDHVESFSVNDDDNYWHCFACGTGGSIIDFWMEWQKCDFRAAVKELASMLL